MGQRRLLNTLCIGEKYSKASPMHEENGEYKLLSTLISQYIMG